MVKVYKPISDKIITLEGNPGQIKAKGEIIYRRISNGIFTATGTYPIYTIPAGKFLKIYSVYFSGQNSINGGQELFSIYGGNVFKLCDISAKTPAYDSKAIDYSNGFILNSGSILNLRFYSNFGVDGVAEAFIYGELFDNSFL